MRLGALAIVLLLGFGLIDLVVNLKIAKAIGIKIPEPIMLRATQVIR